MIEYVVYYGDNGEKCVLTNWRDRRHKLPPGAKWDFPDEVQLLSVPLIIRDKTVAQLEEAKLRRRYGIRWRYAAKDIPLSQAISKEFK